MCPHCWGMLPLCDVCLTNSAHPERLLWPTYTMRAEPGQYNAVLMPVTGRLSLTLDDITLSATGA